MFDNLNKKIWLVGAGDMASEYAKVLDDLKEDYAVIGRGKTSAESFEQKTKHIVFQGGVEKAIQTASQPPSYAIVVVYPGLLKKVTIELIKFGVKKILVEKPAGLNREEIIDICNEARQQNANVYVAYNRRFLASVIEARKRIIEDGGVKSFNFEFTEWAHVIEQLSKPSDELENWFMANSTHVVDLALFLGGEPKQMTCFVTGETDWYKRASAFAGAGISKSGALFSYKANWKSAGRWSIEVLTEAHKYILCPLEKLQIQNRGSVQTEFIKLDDELDCLFKPGLYKQLVAFLNADYSDMIDIFEHARYSVYYEMMEKNCNANFDNN